MKELLIFDTAKKFFTERMRELNARDLELQVFEDICNISHDRLYEIMPYFINRNPDPNAFVALCQDHVAVMASSYTAWRVTRAEDAESMMSESLRVSEFTREIGDKIYNFFAQMSNEKGNN